jgi:hypothetical protein
MRRDWGGRRLRGKSNCAGLWKCHACRQPFTVRMGTVLKSSHVPLHIWLQVLYLMYSSKEGISTRQIHRTRWKYENRFVPRPPRPRGCVKTVDIEPMASPGRPGKRMKPTFGGSQLVPRVQTARGQASRVRSHPTRWRPSQVPRPQRDRNEFAADHRPHAQADLALWAPK